MLNHADCWVGKTLMSFKHILLACFACFITVGCGEWFKLTFGCRLKEKGRTFREAFLAKLGLLLRGTVAAPPERYGETLADEHIRGGTKSNSASPGTVLCRCIASSSGDAASASST